MFATYLQRFDEITELSSSIQYGMLLNGYPKGKQAIVFVFIFITEIFPKRTYSAYRHYYQRTGQFVTFYVETYHINLMDIRS